LLAFSLHSGHKLRDELQKIYSHKHPPILCYEILAHLLNHRFLDAIINFNFDELLDKSIEDELGEGEYYKIISDGDCPELLLDEDLFKRYNYKCDLPVYIKPHGTASHKSTLRFTRDDYFGLPNDIRRVLSNLLISPERPLTIVSIGFSMQSFEFNHIINEIAANSEIFYINKSIPNPKPKLSNYSQQFIEVSNGETLNECLKNLWEQTYERFEESFLPRGIERHILISEVFTDWVVREGSRFCSRREYLENRTKIELLLAITKAKGLINMSDLSSDRCGKYNDLYRNESIRCGYQVIPLYEMCSYYDFVETEYGHELLRWKKRRGENDLFDRDKLILKINDFQHWISSIFPIVYYIYNASHTAQKSKEELKNFLTTLIEKIYAPEETEIKTKHGNMYNTIFKNPTILRTKTALKIKTLELLKCEWTRMVLVAESGAWLLEDHIVKLIKERSEMEDIQLEVCVIVADETYKDDLKEKYIFCKMFVTKLNWWEHNRHMTIFLDANNSPIASIYFVRRMRSPNITPISLERDDSEIILKMFCAYYEKTKQNDQRMVDFSKIQTVQKYLQKNCLSEFES
jgi:hypothetical protein